MADTTFTNSVTLTDAAWFQDINNVYYRLSANRIPYATGTALTSSANLTFDGTTLTVNTLTVSTGSLTVTGGVITTGATTALSLGTTGGTQLSLTNLAAVDERVTVRGGDQSTRPSLGVTGTATNIPLLLGAKGNEGISFYTDLFGTPVRQLLVTHTASSSVFIQITGSNGNAAQITASATQPRLTDGARIGADSSNNLLDDASNGASSATLYIGNASINVTSDIRRKANILDTQRDALDIISKLRVVDHTWNDPTDKCENNRNTRGTWMGIIAQEAIEYVPWLVNKPLKPEDTWFMDMQYSMPLFAKAFQQVAARLEVLEGR